MKKFHSSSLWMLTLVALFFLGCETHENDFTEGVDNENLNSYDANNELIAKELLKITDWDQTNSNLESSSENKGILAPTILNFRRDNIGNKIAHYSFELQVGSGEHDIIRIHRVVKERFPFVPIKSSKAIFMQHGDATGFESTFMPGLKLGSKSDDFGVAAYLAQNNIDVWGIDQAWILVPTETNDFGFMSDWGIQKQIDDLKTAMSVAYLTRLFSGNGNNKFILSGYSSGAITGFSLLNEETQYSNNQKLVRAYIPIDLPLKVEGELLKNTFINDYNDQIARIDQGIYQEAFPFHTLATLATVDPDGASPIVPGLTNLQVIPVILTTPSREGLPFHYLSGIWEGELPTGVQFVTIDDAIDFTFSSSPYEPLKFMAELSAFIGDEQEVIFDDYLNQIEVPILYVGAAGGMGYYLDHSKSLLPNSNITDLFVSLNLPPELAVFDYGHTDLFLASNAEEVVWSPILNWINQQ